MIDAVPHKVGEGIREALQKRAVEFHIVAENLKLDFLIQLVAQIPDDACEFPKKAAHWLKAGSHDGILKIRSDRADLLHCGLHLGIVGAIIRAAGYPQEAVAAENHLAGEVHERVEKTDTDANGFLRFASRRGNRLGINRRRCGLCGLRRDGGDHRSGRHNALRHHIRFRGF